MAVNRLSLNGMKIEIIPTAPPLVRLSNFELKTYDRWIFNFFMLLINSWNKKDYLLKEINSNPQFLSLNEFSNLEKQAGGEKELQKDYNNAPLYFLKAGLYQNKGEQDDKSATWRN